MDKKLIGTLYGEPIYENSPPEKLVALIRFLISKVSENAIQSNDWLNSDERKELIASVQKTGEIFKREANLE